MSTHSSRPLVNLPIIEIIADNSNHTASTLIPLEAFFANIRSITVKVTAGCNLKCTYCNVDTVAPNTPKMSLAIWKRIADLLIRNSRHKEVSMEFHGGEPLLLGVDFLVEAAAYAYELGRQNGKVVDVPLVTNGTLLRPKTVERLKQAHIGIAVSCDGPRAINDLVRGGGYAVERAIRLLKDMNYLGGIMTVMSHANWDHMFDIMEWFRALGVRGFAINCIQPQGRGISHGLLSADQMYGGMMQVFRHMSETSVSVLENKLCQQIQRFFEGRDPKAVGCWDFECQAGKTYVSIDLHGNIHACGSDVTNHILGSINDSYIDSGHCDRKLVALHRKAGRTLECFDCRARRICDHSCPTADYNTMAYAEAECLATKKTWRYFCENVEKVRLVYSKMQQVSLN